MMPESIAGRVVKLEEEMTTLRELPNEVRELRLQIVQLRDEIRSEFSAMRADLIAKMDAGDEGTRRQMRVLHEDIIGRLALLDERRASGKRRRKKP